VQRVARAPAGAREPHAEAISDQTTFAWRQILGSFTVRIPVTDKKIMLPIEENTLAILKWRYEQANPLYRWRPVWRRLIELTEQRVAGLGGDPGKIPPSLGGYHGGKGRPDHDGGDDDDRHRDRDEAATGKIDGVVYDRFGDFAGFHLRTEGGRERRYRAREADIERLVMEAWRDRWVVTVIADEERRDDDDPAPWVERLILRRRGG
jgi:hypothetical protein